MTQTAKKTPFSMNVDLMHGPIFKNLLLFRGEFQRLRVKGDGRKQVKGFVLFGGGQHALFHKAVQRRLGDAHLVQLSGGQGAAFQRFHGGQLARAGLRLFGQLPRQRVQPLGRAAQTALHDVLTVHDGRAVLRTVRDYRFDGLEPGAEGALFQKAHQLQQIRRQASVLGRGVVQGFQPLGGVSLVHFLHSQHNGHPGFVTPAKRHQHHAAGKNPADQLCRNGVGIQPVKVDVRVVYGGLGKCQRHSSLPCCSLNWMME